MATFVNLINLTDQGMRNVKESPKRFEVFKAMAEKHGVTVKCAYWTVGRYDMVVIVEGEEEATMAALLSVATLGNVTTETLRAYSADEMGRILGAMT